MPAHRVPPTVLRRTVDTPLPLDDPAPQPAATPPLAAERSAMVRGRRRVKAGGVKPDCPGDDWSWDRTREVMDQARKRKAEK